MAVRLGGAGQASDIAPTAVSSSAISSSCRFRAFLARANEPAAEPAAATPKTGPTTIKFHRNAESPERGIVNTNAAASREPQAAPMPQSVEGTFDQTGDGRQQDPALPRTGGPRQI